jgi:signal transduction histidine kinase
MYLRSATGQIPPRTRPAYAGITMDHRPRQTAKRWIASRQALWVDAGLVALLGALSLAAVWQSLFPGADTMKVSQAYGSVASLRLHAAGWLAATLAELGVLSLRRRFPVPVFALTLCMAVAHSMVLPTVTPSPGDLAVAIAVYTMASTRPRHVSATATSAGILFVAGLDVLLASWAAPGRLTAKTMTAPWLVKPYSLVIPALVLAAAWIAGDSARTRRAYLAVVERRAHDAERDLARQAELGAAAERERITRELHDVIAHALSVMVIQAQGAGSALRRGHSGVAADALNAIVATGRGALAETRGLLGVIRTQEADLAPLPALRDLPALVASIRQAGTPVRLEITGEARPLPDGVELSAFRIIQEALTNTMKHAGPDAAAAVSVRYADDGLELDITDTGCGPADGSSADGIAAGHGLAGMRARVALLGGELWTGAAPGAGYRVRARLAYCDQAGQVMEKS